ncbi:hypothetical protein EUTSA_v10021794mg [Eutrema salsugineum]|uniref:Uncharacterized protein n=1 Tax=Eutrema salsugineum TaxID=72664 RepID=V4M657_EUTSA|nr:hypothetical protein EUTSA_v10021794mg [Eutrema salsugineum]
MVNRPKSGGITPEIWLFLRSKCIKLERLVNDFGIGPEIRLSATFKTANRCNRPMSLGIPPEIWFPIRSSVRRKGRRVMHFGISPEIPFQSAIVMAERRGRLQIAGEIRPVMKPVR